MEELTVAQLQVGGDESNDGNRRTHVSIWEIEPVNAPFFMCPTPIYRLNRKRQPGFPDGESAASADLDKLFQRTMPWLGEDMSKDAGLSLVQWMNLQQSALQPSYLSPSSGPILPQILKPDSLQFNGQRSTTQLDQLQKLAVSATMYSLVSVIQPQHQMPSLGQQTSRQNALNQSLPQNRDQSPIQSQNVLQQQSSVQNHHQEFSQSQQKSLLPP